MNRNIFVLAVIAALVLSACSSAAQPTAIPTISLETGSSPSDPVSPASRGGGVLASAVVVPVQEAQMSFSVAGGIQKVHVFPGTLVKAGDVMAELENTSLRLDVEAAQRAVRELTSAAAVAAAGQAVASAQDAFEDASKKLESIKYRRTDNVTIDYLQDQVTLAQDALDRAREAYKQTARLSKVDPTRAKAATNLYNAQKAYNMALGNLNWYANPPAENDVALAAANLDAATAALQEAKWYAAELRGEKIPADASGMQLAQLQQARANLQAAQDRLEHTILRSPISGVVTGVSVLPGEYVMPGQVVITISNVDHLQVKTTDLSERDVTRIQTGAPARILVEALSEEYEGEVIWISPVAGILGGDVVYEVTLEFTEQPEGLLGGMSAEVTIEE